jgi:chemotaxis protein methyltransferase CheR
MTALSPSSGGATRQASVVDGEFILTGEDFARIAALLHDAAGIHLPESKATLVYSRLTKRLRALGLASFRDYCTLVSGSDGADERSKMLAALTTNVTRFFREPHHFEHLRNIVLPPLLQAARTGGRIRIWSAGCSSGQEPYSIALTILGLLPDASNFDIKILASDIDPNIVEEARQGLYSESALEHVPASLRSRWFVSSAPSGGKMWQIAPQVAELVALRELNLLGPWPMKGRFHAIFCRNVTIYFNSETRDKLWTRFAHALLPGGYLYIGHSERVGGTAVSQLQPSGVTTYKWLGGNP